MQPTVPCARCGHDALLHLPEEKSRGECCAYSNVQFKTSCSCQKFTLSINADKKEARRG